MIRQYPALHEPHDGSVEDSPIVRLWYGLLTDCLSRKYERIHLFLSDPSELPERDEFDDPDEDFEAFRTFTIRAYTGGAREELMKPSAKMYAAFLQRLKIMAGFSLARRPPIEQGRFHFTVRNSVYEIQVTVRAPSDSSQEAMVDLPLSPLQKTGAV